MSSSPVLPNFINGEFVASLAAPGTVDVVNPADGITVAKVPLSTFEDVNQAVSFGLQAFASWKDTTIKQRAGIMFKLHELIDIHKNELAEIIVRENGKNIVEALADIAKGNETVEWACSLPQLAAGRVLEVSKGITCCESRGAFSQLT